MSRPISAKDICERIWSLEKELGLLHVALQGVKVWQLLRMETFYRIAQATGVYDTPHTSKENLLDIAKCLPMLIEMFRRHPLRGNHRKDILVFDHKRKIPVDGERIDIYTKYLLDTLEEGSFEVLEAVYLGKHLTRKAETRKYLDIVVVKSFLKSAFFRVRFTDEELALIGDLEQRINDVFGIPLPLKKAFAAEIAHYTSAHAFYTKLLRKRRPKRIYLVVSYSFYIRPLIAAAKALGIETVELQHGTLSPYHMGYNFPDCDGELDYFPDRFYSFGDYWNTAAEYPLPKDRIETFGFQYFHRQKEKYANIAKSEKKILFVSQGVVGKSLSEFAVECAKKLADREVVYKLHPGECDRWRAEYPLLRKAADAGRLEVVDHNEKNLYEHFAESAYQVGVFSTAIYEGLAFGCKTFIVDLPGVEYMEDLIRKGVVRRIARPEELRELVEVPSETSFDSDYFFKGCPKSC